MFRAGAGHLADNLVSYIIRRLVAAVMLVVVISMVTFAIFYLIPRLAGASPETLAARYVGRSTDSAVIKQTAEKLGFYDPVPVQYWNWAKGVVVGTTYDYGAGVEKCPAPCLGYSFRSSEPVLPDILRRLPVTLSLAIGAAIIWVVAGVSVGVLSALKRGSFFDRFAMTFALAGVSLPIFWTGLVALSLFSYQLGWTPPGASYVKFTDNPAKWAYGLILPWTTLALLFSAQYARHTRAGMLETMGEDYIRTARAKGHARTQRRRQARPARRTDPHRDHLRSRLRPADRRCRAHRDGVRAPRSRAAGHHRHEGERPPTGARRTPGDRSRRRSEQPDRRPRVRRT